MKYIGKDTCHRLFKLKIRCSNKYKKTNLFVESGLYFCLRCFLMVVLGSKILNITTVFKSRINTLHVYTV